MDRMLEISRVGVGAFEVGSDAWYGPAPSPYFYMNPGRGSVTWPGPGPGV
jgi:hypothetical protein